MPQTFGVTVAPNCPLDSSAKRQTANTLFFVSPGLRKTRVFSKKNNPPGFFCCFIKKNVFFCFFKKKQDFVLFLRKIGKTLFLTFLLHHAISLFSVLHNNNMLYLLCHSNLRVKECTPSLFLQIFGQFTPKWKCLARMRTANREKPFPHKLCSFMSSLSACPASSASIAGITNLLEAESYFLRAD